MKATSPQDHKASPRARVFKRGLVMIAVAGVIVLSRLVDVQQAFRQALTWISDLAAMGLLVLILLYIMACVLLLPGSVLTLGTGVVFGVTQATLIVSVASAVGATCAFLVGRFLARDGVGARIAEWVLYGVGLLATIGVTFFVTRLAKRALNERIAV